MNERLRPNLKIVSRNDILPDEGDPVVWAEEYLSRSLDMFKDIRSNQAGDDFAHLAKHRIAHLPQEKRAALERRVFGGLSSGDPDSPSSA